MTFVLDESIQAMIKDGAGYLDIRQAMDTLYDSQQKPEYKVSDLSHTLSCYVVHFGHEELLQRGKNATPSRFQNRSMGPQASITAIHERKLDGIYKGVLPQDITSLLSIEGYGIFAEDHSILTQHPTTPGDLIMERDDTQFLKRLLPEMKEFAHFEYMFQLAVKHRALGCFKQLLSHYRRISKRTKFNKKKFNELVNYLDTIMMDVAGQEGYISQHAHAATRSMFLYLSNIMGDVSPDSSINFLSDESAANLGRCSATNIMKFHDNHIKRSNLESVIQETAEWLLPITSTSRAASYHDELFHEVVLQCYRFVLDCVVQKADVNPDYCVQTIATVFTNVQKVFDAQLAKMSWDSSYTYAGARYEDAAHGFLFLLKQVSQLLLDQSMCILACCRQSLAKTLVANPSQIHGHARVFMHFLGVYVNKYRYFLPRNFLPHVSSQLALMIAYGVLSPDYFCSHNCLVSNNKSSASICSEFRSVLQHENYEQYRSMAKSKTSHLLELQERKENEDEQVKLKKWLHYNKFPACRSLHELCRSKLYSAVPHRNMVYCTPHFDLPMHEELYLTFGVASHTSMQTHWYVWSA